MQVSWDLICFARFQTLGEKLQTLFLESMKDLYYDFLYLKKIHLQIYREPSEEEADWWCCFLWTEKLFWWGEDSAYSKKCVWDRGILRVFIVIFRFGWWGKKKLLFVVCALCFDISFIFSEAEIGGTPDQIGMQFFNEMMKREIGRQKCKVTSSIEKDFIPPPPMTRLGCWLHTLYVDGHGRVLPFSRTETSQGVNRSE